MRNTTTAAATTTTATKGISQRQRSITTRRKRRTLWLLFSSSSFVVMMMMMMMMMMVMFHLVVVIVPVRGQQQQQVRNNNNNKKGEGTVGASSATTTTKPTNTKSSTTKTTQPKPLPRRERNLDHWDAETLAFYLHLDPTTAKPLTTTTATPSSSFYPGYDVAIMFYASWCKNCHALAPYWDRIATHLQAGTNIQSKLIMALFDCERNVQHERLCTAASVSHYPTLLFVGSGVYHDIDPITKLILGTKRAAGPAGPTSLPYTVKFQGNWKYADAVLDWIHTMQWISTWQQPSSSQQVGGRGGGWMRSILQHGLVGAILAPLRRNRSTTTTTSGGSNGGGLPIGVPPGSSSHSQQQLSVLEKKIHDLNTTTKEYKNLLIRSSTIVDALLFPIGQPSQINIQISAAGGRAAVGGNNNNNKNANATATTRITTAAGPATIGNNNNSNKTTLSTTTTSTTTSSSSLPSSTGSYDYNQFTDVFAVLHEQNGWNMSIAASKANPTLYVILSCTLDVVLDVCQRVNTHVTNDVAKHIDALEKDGSTILQNYTKLNQLLDSMVEEREPYCGITDACLKKNFRPVECKPPVCPFRDPAACRYLTACMTKSIQTEYAIALDLIQEGETFPPPVSTTSKFTTSGASGGFSSNTNDKKSNKQEEKKSGLWGMF